MTSYLPWLTVIMIMVYDYFLATVAIKKIGSPKGSRTRKLVWQFFFCAVAGFFLWLGLASEQSHSVVTDMLTLDMSTGGWVLLSISLVGVFNAFAGYCQWRAVDQSMTRTALLTSLDDIIPIVLGMLILGEATSVSTGVIIGMVISVVAAITFAVIKAEHDSEGKPLVDNKALIGWVVGYSLIWGVAAFLFRVWGVAGVEMYTFIMFWYAGSWLGALGTKKLMGAEEAGPPLTGKQYAQVFLLSFFIATTLMLSYYLRTIMDITAIQPISMVAEIVMPLLAGVLIFKEAKTLRVPERLILLASLLGVGLIIKYYAFG